MDEKRRRSNVDAGRRRRGQNAAENAAEKAKKREKMGKKKNGSHYVECEIRWRREEKRKKREETKKIYRKAADIDRKMFDGAAILRCHDINIYVKFHVQFSND